MASRRPRLKAHDPNEIARSLEMARGRKRQGDQLLAADTLLRPLEVYAYSVEGEDALAWVMMNHDTWEQGESYKPDPKILERFIALEKAPVSRFVQFAKKYGGLLVCREHFLPAYDGCRHERKGRPCTVNVDTLESKAVEWVLLGVWREEARAVRAALDIARRLHAGKPADPADWTAIDFSRRVMNVDIRSLLGTAARERQLLEVVLTRWIEFAGLRPSFRWQNAELPHIGLEGERGWHSGAYGAVIRQLVIETSRTGDLTICRCGNAFRQKEGPGRPRVWCRDCGDAGRVRAAQKRYRRKQMRRA